MGDLNQLYKLQMSKQTNTTQPIARFPENINTVLIQLLIVGLGLLLFLPGLGAVHLFDWDEINFAESAREMIVTGNYLDVQINSRLLGKTALV